MLQESTDMQPKLHNSNASFGRKERKVEGKRNFPSTREETCFLSFVFGRRDGKKDR